jgi:hypothetical protein
MQDVTELAKDIPEESKVILKGTTDLGQIADNVKESIMGGNLELHSVRISKRIPLVEAQKKAQEIIKNKNKKKMKEMKNWYNFRVKPKSHFTKKFVVKKINNDIQLVLGEPL